MPLIADQKRRSFLHKGLKWGMGLAAALSGYPLMQFTRFSVKPKPIRVEINTPLKGGGHLVHGEFILFSGDGDTPNAVSRICTHLGCRVNYRQELGVIECPCHQSQYTIQGIRLKGPAPDNLPSLPVESLRDQDGRISGYVVTL